MISVELAQARLNTSFIVIAMLCSPALYKDCKVALATLCTELTRIQDGRYAAVDPTSPGLSMPYRSFTA